MRAHLRWTHAVVLAALCVHIVFLWAVHSRALGPYFADTRNRPGPAGDFFAVYHAGRQTVTDLSPYMKAESPTVTPAFAPFRYPPGVAQTLGRLVIALPPWTAYVGWIVVLEGLLVACLLASRRLFQDPRLADLVAAGWLLYTPFFLELWMGQFTFFAASLTFLAFLWPRAGALWAYAAMAKLFPLALVPLWLRQRRWLTLAGGVVMLALGMLWFVWHPADYRIFKALNGTQVDIPSFHAGNQGLQAFLYKLLAWIRSQPVPAAMWKTIALALALGLTGLAGLVMTFARRIDPRESAALGLMLLPLVSKHAWEHHYVVALPAMTLLASAWQGQRRGLAAVAAAYVPLALPTLVAVWQERPSMWDPEVAWTLGQRALYHAQKPVALLALFVATLAVTSARSLRRAPAPAPSAPGS